MVTIKRLSLNCISQMRLLTFDFEIMDFECWNIFESLIDYGNFDVRLNLLLHLNITKSIL